MIDYRHILDLALDDWTQAHELVQPHADALACQIHAYLHRLENDNDNAAYWYRRAEREFPDNSLEQERQRLYTLIDDHQPCE